MLVVKKGGFRTFEPMKKDKARTLTANTSTTKEQSLCGWC
jgi:hypothetical protein